MVVFHSYVSLPEGKTGVKMNMCTTWGKPHFQSSSQHHSGNRITYKFLTEILYNFYDRGHGHPHLCEHRPANLDAFHYPLGMQHRCG